MDLGTRSFLLGRRVNGFQCNVTVRVFHCSPFILVGVALCTRNYWDQDNQLQVPNTGSSAFVKSQSDFFGTVNYSKKTIDVGSFFFECLQDQD